MKLPQKIKNLDPKGLLKKTIIISFFLLLALSLTGCKKKTQEQPSQTKKTAPVINQMSVKERPYVSLKPRADGKEVSMTLYDNKGAETVEYELEYKTGDMLQGAFGRIDFSQESLPVSKQLLFGSCSKGKCKYDDNISGGSLTLRFEAIDEFVLKGNFSLQQMQEVEGVFTSANQQVALDVGPKALSNDSYMIVFDTLGLPEEIKREVVAGPYGFFMAKPPKGLKTASLSWQSKEDLSQLKVFGYINNQWQEYSQNLSVENNRLSVSVDQLGTFVLVK